MLGKQLEKLPQRNENCKVPVKSEELFPLMIAQQQQKLLAGFKNMRKLFCKTESEA